MKKLHLDSRHQVEQSLSLIEYLNDYIVQNNIRDRGVIKMQRFLNSITTYDRSLGFRAKDAMVERYPNMSAVIDQVLEDAELRGDAFEYADTFRMYAQRDEFGELLFRMIDYCGCCGSAEGSVTIDGVYYIYGFNYGH